MFNADNFTPVANIGEFHTSLLIGKLLSERGTTVSTGSTKFLYRCPKGHTNIIDVMNALEIKPVNLFQYQHDTALVEFAEKNFIQIFPGYQSDNTIFSFRCFGDPQWATDMKNKYAYETDFKAVVSWSYKSGGHLYSKDFEIDEPQSVYDEYYPYIEGGIHEYFDRYFKSSASILILIGEPGTGKTSLIRNLLWERKLHATMTFDEDVMAEESYFVGYASSDDHNLMIVEDADLLLASRQSEQNKLMTKLLNISEGLIRLDRKKIIFSTNLSNINKIDPALIRPGRCFDILRFRTLTKFEAETAADKAGVTLANDKKEYTLAEVFNCSKKHDTDKIGFRLVKTA